MNLIWSIISGLFVLNVVVIVHEYGHYVTAKRAGVYTPKFAIGFGPKILTFYKNEHTSFELKLIPFGGYVQMASKYEEDDIEIPEGKSTLEQINKWRQIWIIAAGATFNVIFAALIYFCVGLFSPASTADVAVNKVIENGPSSQILKKDDVIQKINGHKISSSSMLPLFIEKNNKIEILRDNKKLTKNIKAKQNPQNKKLYFIGIEQKFVNIKHPSGVFAAVKNIGYSFKNVYDMQMATFKMLFSGRAKINDMSGPVGIIRATSKVVDASPTFKQKAVSFLNWMALISIAIGLTNIILFFIPVVDGGRIFLILLSMIFKKELADSKVVMFIMNLFVYLLLMFFVYITFIDLFRKM